MNGQSIGRYWPSFFAFSNGCNENCDYRGPYGSGKCRKNCGKPSQELYVLNNTHQKFKCQLEKYISNIMFFGFHSYHVPRSWLKPSGNTLVLFEEMGGDPTEISFATRQIQSLCAQVSETHPLPVDMWSSDSTVATISGPVLSLKCPFPKQVISSIKFASFGTPIGSCGKFSHGQCRNNMALSIVWKV